MENSRGLIKALENWAKKVTTGYRDVHVENMSSSFRDGLAFCAIIHHYRPDLIDFDSLSKENIFENNSLAFSVAEKQLSVPALLDAEDMVKYAKPDRLSIITYLSQLRNCFENQNRVNRLKDLKRIQANSVGPPKKVQVTEPTLLPPKRHEVCQVCKNRVFLLERLIVDKKLYHTTCFRCHKCNCLLNPGAYVESDTPGIYECTVCLSEESMESSDSDLQTVDSSVEKKEEESDSRFVLRTEALPKKDFTEESSIKFARRNLLQETQVLENVLHSSEDNALKSDSLIKSEVANNTSPVSVKDKISVFEKNQTSPTVNIFNANISPLPRARHSFLNSSKEEPLSSTPSHRHSLNTFESSKLDSRNEPSFVNGGSFESLNKVKSSFKISDIGSQSAVGNSSENSLTTESKTTSSLKLNLETSEKANNLSSKSDLETSERANNSLSLFPDRNKSAENTKENKSPASSLKLTLETTGRANNSLSFKSNLETSERANSSLPLSPDLNKSTENMTSPLKSMYESPFRKSGDIFKTTFQPLSLRINKTEPSSLTPELSENKKFDIPEIKSYSTSLPRLKTNRQLSMNSLSTSIKQTSSENTLNNKQDNDTILTLKPELRDKSGSREKYFVKDASAHSDQGTTIILNTSTSRSVSVNEKDLLESKSRVAKVITSESKIPTEMPSEVSEILKSNVDSKHDLKSDAISSVKNTPHDAVDEKDSNLKVVESKETKTTDKSPFESKDAVLPVTEKEYPDDLNPFEDEEKEDDYPDDLNPFGDDDEDDSIVIQKPENKSFASADDYDESKNPFASDEEEDESSLNSTSTPSKPYSSLNLNSIPSTPSPPASLKGTLKKRPAPKPPKLNDIFQISMDSGLDSSINSAKSSPTGSKKSFQMSSPKVRKNKPAPRPPVPPPPVSNGSPADAAANAKIEKNSDNQKLKSTSQPPKPKKKRPAPPVPVSIKKDMKKIPLKEIIKEMKEIEQKQREYEKQGRELELLIRDRDKDEEPSVEEEEYIIQLFELVNRKNALFRRQAELMYIKRSQRLEEEQQKIEKKIRQLLEKPESEKTEEDRTKEEELTLELIDIVDQRNSIIDSIEMDRRRELEEDHSVQEQMELKTGTLPITAEIKEKSSGKAKKNKKKDKKEKKRKWL